MRLHPDSKHLREERETLTDVGTKVLGNKFNVCLYNLSLTYTNNKKEKVSIQMFISGIPKRKAAKAQFTKPTPQWDMSEGSNFSFSQKFHLFNILEKKNPAQILLLYFHISKTILNISSLDLVLTVLFLPNISFNVELTNYQLDQFVTTSLSSFNRSTTANRMVLQRILPCQPSKSSPWTKNVNKTDLTFFVVVL